MNINTLLKSFKLAWNRLRGFFPEELPTGATSFQQWADSIIETYALPTPDRESILFVLATGVVNLSGPIACYKSKYYFVRLIRTAAAKQVASDEFMSIKQRHFEAQKAAKEAEKAKQLTQSPQLKVVPAEATANNGSGSEAGQ